MVWYGYGAAGYKESVQTSATHNMVVVDELQQEAVPSEQLLFYAGEVMQVSLVETKARWREIPRHNLDKFPPWDDKEFDPTFEPVTQRRLMVVTDDYIVIADYLDAPQEHTYDWLIHPVGLSSTEGLRAKGKEIDAVSTSGDSPYKYFTNGQWYTSRNGARVNFDDQGMKLDIHTLYPQKSEAFIAYYPCGGKFDGDIRNNPERRTYGVRTKAKSANYLHIIEPYRGDSAIESIESSSPLSLNVKLRDGRTQQITISDIEGDNPTVEITESSPNSTTITERAGN